MNNQKTNQAVAITRRKCFWCILALLLTCDCLFAQSGTISGSGTHSFDNSGNVTVVGQKVFRTHVATSNDDVQNMVKLNVGDVVRLVSDVTGGIKGRINNPNGHIKLSVYTYTTASSGNLLYRVTLTSNSLDAFSGNPETQQHPSGHGNITSNRIKDYLPYRVPWLYTGQSVSFNLFEAAMGYLHNQVHPWLQSEMLQAIKNGNFDPEQPVYIEVEMKDATLLSLGIKVPGISQPFDLASYFDPSSSMSVVVKVNGSVAQTYQAGNVNPSPLNVKMGDLLSFEVSNTKNKPTIEGLPAVWIARFAGDLMFYCTPSVTPGEHNPWIGYDSRVHNMQVRNMSGDSTFIEKVPDWAHPSASQWTFNWTAQRRMTSSKTKYEASFTWPKYKTLSRGGIQRNNQREGLNMQFLDYWLNGVWGDFSRYDGDAKYMMGFDDDELLYLNSQSYDAIHHPPLREGGIVKLDSIPSRGMPEGVEQLYNVKTGYPSQGFPLNTQISAYKRNRLYHETGSYYPIQYDGYEIQDIGTDEQHPDGTASGNNTAPGVIYIKSGGKVVTIKINSTSPQSVDAGFYGSITGNRWPAYGENGITYVLNGLNGLSDQELNKFSMVYQGCDALGTIKTQTKWLKDLSAAEKNTVRTTGKWSASFDNSSPTYSAIVAYYQRGPEGENIIIAGKELKPIFLLFLGESSLEGKGLGAKIWLNDFRDTQSSEYSVERHFGNRVRYTKPNTREYTFPTGTTTTFEAWDGDPHIFYDSGVEWFLSSRTLAKRIPDNYLDGTSPDVSVPYLKYYINDVEQTAGRSGKSFTYTWNTPGVYTLKVVYRVNGTLTAYQHKIKIINYTSSPNQHKGTITWRDLSPKEIQWLNISQPSNYKIFEVKDVYSKYMYQDGPRANSPLPNRWADYNDYASQYEWNLPTLSNVTAFLISYSNVDWFWFYWALHYSSNWRDHAPDGLPPYVRNDQVTRVITTELDKFSDVIQRLFVGLQQGKWQYTVPLVSHTDFQGERMRTNPSCLYDLNYMFNNTNGAFTGTVVAPTDPIYIQAPDITDDQKDKMELYYGLKSGRLLLVDVSSRSSIPVSVRNVYGSVNNFIAEALYTR